MIAYFQENWGSFVGALSLIVTVVGFVVAIRRVTQARASARAAEDASKETMAAIARVLSVSDISRAIGLISRIKDFHRDQKWEVSLQHYQILRATLTDIRHRLPAGSSEINRALRSAVPQISVMETSVDQAIRANTPPDGEENFARTLTSLQEHLEDISSSTQLWVGEAGM